jgi:hypothetical protein
VRAATLLARPDGGHGDLLIARAPADPAPDLRAVQKRAVRHGFEGHVRGEIASVNEAVAKAQQGAEHSLVIVDDPTFATAPGLIPLLVVDGDGAGPPDELLAAGDSDTLAAEIKRRLARDKQWRDSTPPDRHLTRSGG